MSPVSLLIGNSLNSASTSFPEFHWADSSSRSLEKGGDVIPGRNSQRAALGQVPVSPSTDTCNNSVQFSCSVVSNSLRPYECFELFCRSWNLLQVGKVSKQWWEAAHKHVDLRPVGPEGWWCWLLTTNPSEDCPHAHHALCEQLLYNFSLPSPSWDTQLGRH